MSKLTYAELYLKEVSMRKRNLETKQQVQAAENAKELEMLMLIEIMLEKIVSEAPNE
jgi:hypothetical protein